ncbi:conjugal transfer protein TraT [Fluviibacter phosphoraccumulans]|uniref:Conjugal transfer protein TraT n=1 Tax=Fluviibacter phosphoraccumulans TaxID=1751046 RepID=A0A7R6R6E1_9RHOO|nr:conjugal transfer protein TraT [Fluviibacter phosphoraccumulans]BBU72053.1 conjugal transfer protein TraT [Fluviibacter phosphoraccumulans]
MVSYRKWIVVVLLANLVMGCAATQLAISKRNLDVQTKLSDTIFLSPTSDRNKTVFIQVRNTTDKTDFDLAGPVRQSLQAKGYQVLNEPDNAWFILQANILSIEKTSNNPASSPFGSYGSALGGAGIGALAASAGNANGRQIAGTALAAGAASGIGEMLANALIKDVYFSVITDVQIKERSKNASNVTTQSSLKNGKGTTTAVNNVEDSRYKVYQTRALSVANQANLNLEEAEPMLQAGLTKVISGIF